MNFRDDDFYSTKTSSRSGLNEGLRATNKYKDNKLVIGLFAFLIGIILTIFIQNLLDDKAHVAVDVNGVSENRSIALLEEVRLDYNQLVVRAVERVQPAVVSVIHYDVIPKEEGEEWPESDEGSTSLGSGIVFQIIGDKALIVTNNHVVQDAEKIEIVLSSGDKKAARVIGMDTFTDLAVLEVNASGLTTLAEFGDSEHLRAGETAIAIGNPLDLGYSQTVTVGVISSPLRTLPISLAQTGIIDWELDVIQTDAAINQGYSGGALVNLEGKVIGINSMKVAYMGVEGLGFAIPIHQAIPIIDSLIMDGKVKRPAMGVHMQDLQSFLGDKDGLKLPKDVKTGVVVMKAVGNALKAGLQANDIIVELDGRKIMSGLDLRKYLYSHKGIGDLIEVKYYRDGKKREASFELGEL